MVSKETLKKHYESLLDQKEIEAVDAWYESIIRKQEENESTCIIFMVRRSLILALIEDCMHESMRLDKSRVFTDSSINIYLFDLCDYYIKNAEFPKLLVCDDLMLHGRSINNFLNDTIKTLEVLYEEKTGNKDVRIRERFIDVLSIELVMTCSDKLLLNAGFERCLNTERWGTAAELHHLSAVISSFIVRSDIANAVFVLSESVKGEDVITKDDTWVRSYYHNTVQYTKTEAVTKGNKVKAILSWRQVKIFGEESWRTVPFVFLPKITFSESMGLWELFEKRVPDENKEVVFRYRELADHDHTKRSWSEAISFLLSGALLSDYRDGIEKAEKEMAQNYYENLETEIEKLAINFNCGDRAVTRSFLKVMSEVSAKVSIDEIKNKLLSLSGDIMRTSQGDCLVKENLSEEIKAMEDKVYEVAKEEEIDAIIQVNSPYIDTISKRTNHFPKIIEHIESRIEQRLSSLATDFALLLQMVDAGVFTIRCRWDKESEDYCQIAMAGGQSLMVKPLGNYKFIPMLSHLYDMCGYFSRNIVDELNRFADGLDDENLHKELREKKEALLEMIDDFEQLNQSPRDWLGNYYSKVSQPGDTKEEKVVCLKKYYSEQVRYYEAVYKYCERW